MKRKREGEKIEEEKGQEIDQDRQREEKEENQPISVWLQKAVKTEYIREREREKKRRAGERD